ncbi:MAG TPA: TPM domain-containing protein [Haliangiales bacterium]|nr:TPM domain-containing protein [Haliangiales bacterium]
MWWLIRKRFARGIDGDRIKRAIEDAERGTTGEIVVSVAPFFFGSVYAAAERAFARLGVARTRERNGVLLFVVPGRRQLAILGDEAIHAKVGQEFWERVAAATARRLGAGDATGGIVDGVAEIGRELARWFPIGESGRVNQLADDPEVG